MSNDRLTPELEALIGAAIAWADDLQRTQETDDALINAVSQYEASLRPQPVECLMTRGNAEADPGGWRSALPLDWPAVPDVETWRVTITPIERVR